jgi:hypothetical protein
MLSKNFVNFFRSVRSPEVPFLQKRDFYLSYNWSLRHDDVTGSEIWEQRRKMAIQEEHFGVGPESLASVVQKLYTGLRYFRSDVTSGPIVTKNYTLG